MIRTLTLTLVFVACCVLGGTCGPVENPAPLPPVAEVEPNNTLDAPQRLDLAGGAVRVSGTIASNEDIDLYALGDLQRGDRVAVTVDAAATDAQISVVLFELLVDDNIGTLFEVSTAGAGTATAGAVLDGVVRNTGPYFLGIMRRFLSAEPGAAYDVALQVEHGQEVAAAVGQILLLDFGGGALVAPDGNTVTIGPWTPADNDAALAPSAAAILDGIAATTRANLAGYNVQVLRRGVDALPADQPFSTVFFGPVLSGEASLALDGLGVAVHGVDSFNTNRSDVAVVFAQLFTPGLFGVASLTPDQLATALGNVASHEIGHLLGLQHVFDPTDLMNTFDSPGTLLQEQRFKRSAVHFFVFDDLNAVLTQDAAGHLSELTGSTRRGPDLELTAGTTPLAITAADFDVDGQIDLAVADFDSSSITLFLNLGERRFDAPISLNAGAGPTDLVTFDADFNGGLDLITANPDAQNLSALYLMPDGFTQPVFLSAGAGPRSLAAGDFNGDLIPDLAVANSTGNSVSILLNDGQGRFQSVLEAAVGRGPQGIVAADLDNDAVLDLAVANSEDNTVTILQGLGDGTFAVQATPAAGVLPSDVAAGDLNGDGRIDLAVASTLSAFALVQYGANVSVLMNQGGGSFAPQVVYPVEPGAESIVAADLNGDGHVDLATSNASDVIAEPGNVSLLLNRGDGTFGQDVVLQAGFVPTALVVADLDGRGAPDLAVANRGSDTVSVFFNE